MEGICGVRRLGQSPFFGNFMLFGLFEVRSIPYPLRTSIVLQQGLTAYDSFRSALRAAAECVSYHEHRDLRCRLLRRPNS